MTHALKTLLFFLIFLLFSCEKRSNLEILNDGLKNYKLKRGVGQKFVEDFKVEEIAFIEQQNHYDLVLKLNKDIQQDVLDIYTLGIHVYTKNSNEDHRRFDVWNIKPIVKNYNGNKYLIREFKEPHKEMDSIIFFLYNNDFYRGILGNRIVIRNIKL